MDPSERLYRGKPVTRFHVMAKPIGPSWIPLKNAVSPLRVESLTSGLRKNR